MQKRCVVCDGSLRSLIHIDNMPASAQDIPLKEELDRDKPINANLCVCESCGLIQLDVEAVSYYKDVIRAGGLSSTMRSLRKAQYTEFIELCNLYGKKVIEVGCGGGEFLSVFREFNIDAYGIENSESLVSRARSEGLNVWRDFSENEKEFLNAPFDAFTSFNFLEHQPNPRDYLRTIYRNLTDDGCGLITVPSFEYIVEENSFYELIRDHIAYYTFESLRNLLSITGFEVLKEERVNRDTLAVIVKKRKIPDIRNIIDKKDYIAADVSRVLDLYKKRAAIWGASHQGFTLISVANLADRVKCIIDSAPFKQGRFSPASHVPIISPDAARSEELDAIIIVAPGYSNEIASIIRETFREGIDIYTLMTDRIEKL